MSTRRSAVAVPNVKKTVGDFLTEFLQQLGNQFCADCLANNPQWIAFPHGVIICDDCAGAHRSLGSHISQVKSIVYDKWTMEMYHKLEKCGGNSLINDSLSKYCEIYEKLTPQSNADDREKFIANKYELKLYTKPQLLNSKIESAKRLAHYFLVVSKSDMILPDKPDKHFIMADSIFAVPFRTCVNYRYPVKDHHSVPLAARVFDFIFPSPLHVSSSSHLPSTRSFVLTDAEGCRQYGVSLIFWERISPMDILSMQDTLNKYRISLKYSSITSMPGAVYSPKAICIISHWPFYKQFSIYLQTLYRITKTPSVPIPIERYLINFMHCVPVPPPGKISVQFVVGDVSITLSRSPPNSLPYLNVDGLNLFKCLSIGNILTLFNALLQERKIVFISLYLHLLLDCCETITTLLFPFNIQGVYMPLLPSSLLDFLHSPVPYLAGVHPSWIKGQNYDDVIFIYLDDDTILTTMNEQLIPLPSRPKQKLEKKLEELLPWLSGSNSSDHNTHDNSSSNKPNNNKPHIKHTLDLLPISNFLTSGSTIQSLSSNNSSKKPKKNKKNKNNKNNNKTNKSIMREIQQTFLKFFTSIMGNYNNKYTDKQRKNDITIRNREYIYFKLNKQTDMYEFERMKFIEEGVDKQSKQFMDCITQTQLFQAFCQVREELLESKSKDIPDDIRYFDEEIIAKRNRSALRAKKMDTPFLDDRQYDIKSIFVANPPNTNDLKSKSYSYQSFPSHLLSSRFGQINNVHPPWNTSQNRKNKSSSQSLYRSKSLRNKHLKNQKTYTALQQLMAMQHTAHINATKSWDNFTVNVLIVQRYIRMIINRQQMFNNKLSIIRIQKLIRVNNNTSISYFKFNNLRKSSIIIQSIFRTYLTTLKYRNNSYYKSTHILQCCFHSYLRLKSFKLLYKSTLTLQSIMRTVLLQRQANNKLNSILIIQSYIRASGARVKLNLIVSSISSCQAVLRGTLLRKQQLRILNNNITGLRREILILWEKTYTSYMYRSKFWIVYEARTYLNLAIHNEEIIRLKQLFQRLSTSSLSLNESISRFNREKLELRRLLRDELQVNIRESLYTSWGINIKSKNKKDSLFKLLFKSSKSPKQSSTTLLTICSSHSSSILDVTSQIELRKNMRIQSNLLLTVFSSLSSMQLQNKSLIYQQNLNKKQLLTIKTQNDEIIHKQNIIEKLKLQLKRSGK